MARKKSKAQQGADHFGQHLALSVAAHLARTQLVPDSPKAADGRHGDTIDAVAQALARTISLYITDPESGEPRQLTPAEVEGAVAKRGATQLVLQDGRTLAGVTLHRADLQQAVVVLKALGLQEFAPQLAAAIQRTAPPAAVRKIASAPDALLERVSEIERLLQPPLLAAQIERAKSAAVFIARRAPDGRIANLAMQLMSTLHEPRDTEDEAPGGFRMALARLRAALDENARA